MILFDMCIYMYISFSHQSASSSATAIDTVFGQETFGRKRHILNVPLLSTRYLVEASQLAAHAHRKLSAVVQKSFARRSFLLMQYAATCTAIRPKSIGRQQQHCD